MAPISGHPFTSLAVNLPYDLIDLRGLRIGTAVAKDKGGEVTDRNVEKQKPHKRAARITGIILLTAAVVGIAAGVKDIFFSDDIVISSTPPVVPPPHQSSRQPNPVQCPQPVPPNVRRSTSTVLLVKIDVSSSSQPCWEAYASVGPGETVRNMISYENLSTSEQDNVVVSTNLPPGVTLLPNTTVLYNSANPNGTVYQSNDIDNGGISIGNYDPGGGAYITFTVAMPFSQNLQCGNTDIRTVGIVHPEAMNQFYNTVEQEVVKSCGP